ncbi:MAG: AbgT family transporter, partial [Bdellovibrionota bacterium]
MLSLRPKQKLILYFLNRVEKVGNRLPDPVTLFFLCAVGVLIFSWAFSMMNLSAIHPADSRVIEVKNLLSLDGIQMIL